MCYQTLLYKTLSEPCFDYCVWVTDHLDQLVLWHLLIYKKGIKGRQRKERGERGREIENVRERDERLSVGISAVAFKMTAFGGNMICFLF